MKLVITRRSILSNHIHVPEALEQRRPDIPSMQYLLETSSIAALEGELL